MEVLAIILIMLLGATMLLNIYREKQINILKNNINQLKEDLKEIRGVIYK